MYVTLLGTGCPQCSATRFGPANLVMHEGHAFLVDCGSGVTQRLAATGATGRDIDAVLLTHLHTDHVVDLYQFVISSWHQGRDRPQKVFGPVGTKTYVEGLMKLWESERNARIAHEQRPSVAALEIEVEEITEGSFFEIDGIKVSAVEVDHRPIMNAFGFVFEVNGEKAVFSGDTAYCENLVQASKGADVLVHECFIHREMPVREGVRSARTVEAVASYHTLSDQVGKVAAEAEVGFLLLNHFVPVDFDRQALIDEVSESFSGNFAVGEDLMKYDITSGTLSHALGHIKLS